MTARLDDMRVFAALAEAGSFTAAGELLELPKQTVSRRVAALEAALGTRLVHRTTRSVRLTDVGRAYAEQCAEVARLAEAANAGAAARGAVPRGLVRVSVAEGLVGHVLTPAVAGLLQRWPEVSVEVSVGDRHVDLVAEGFDMALRVGRPGDGDLVARRLGPAGICYCASPDYLARRGVPKHPQDLDGHDLIVQGPPGSQARWPFLEGGAMMARPVRGRLHADHFGLVLAAILRGVGIGIVPDVHAAPLVEQGALQTVLSESVPPIGAVWLVMPSRRLLAPAVRALVDLLVERYPVAEGVL